MVTTNRRFQGPRFALDSITNIIEFWPGFVCVCDNGRITTVNSFGVSLLGAKNSDQIIGRKFSEFLTAEYAAVFDDLLFLLVDEVTPVPVKLLDHSGAEIAAEITVQWARELSENTFIIKALDISREIHLSEDIHRTEERFRSLIDNALNMICVCKDGKVLFINQSGADLLKANDPNKIAGLSVFELFHKDYQAVFEDGLDDLIAEPSTVPALLQCQDGSTVAVHISVTATGVNGPGSYMLEVNDVSEHRQAVMALKNAHDELELRVQKRTQQLQDEIEERKRVEEDLVKATTEAESANRIKSEFLANMSHELRTPLNAIIGFSETLSLDIHGGLANDNQYEYIDHIHKSGSHLLLLINEILDLSTIEAGKIELNKKELDLNLLLESLFDLVEAQAEERNISVESELSDETCILAVDELRMKQIILNLLTNAIKYNVEGGSMTVGIKNLKNDGVQILISDTGIGMDDDGLNVALSKFGQVTQDSLVEIEGTGLGLPLAKELVEAHGGSLNISSELGIGTTVTVEIPRS